MTAVKRGRALNEEAPFRSPAADVGPSGALAILALPTGVLYATSLTLDDSDFDPSGDPFNAGYFLYGPYGRRAFPTTMTRIAIPASTATTESTVDAASAPTMAGPLLRPSCQDLSSLRFYSPNTTFLFPVPPAQQLQFASDSGGPLAVINGTCQHREQEGAAESNRSGETTSIAVTAMAPVVVSLRDVPGPLPDAFASAVHGVITTVQDTLKRIAAVEVCSLLSRRRWWAVRDLSALQAAMPSPVVDETLTRGRPLMLVAAYAQATADGDASDLNASFPVAAYGYTCVAMVDKVSAFNSGEHVNSGGSVANHSSSGGSSGSGSGSGSGSSACGAFAVAVPVYHLSGLVLAYAFQNDTNGATNTLDDSGSGNHPNGTIRAAMVFVGGMPYTLEQAPVTPAKLNGRGIASQRGAFAFGFAPDAWSRVVLPLAAYADPSLPMLNLVPVGSTDTTDDSSSSSSNLGPNPLQCPLSMANASTPRWAFTMAWGLPDAGPSSCTAFVAEGYDVGLTSELYSDTTQNAVTIHESDYLLLRVLPPPSPSSPLATDAPGAWLFPADAVLSDLFDGLGGSALFGADSPSPEGDNRSMGIPPAHNGVYQFGLYVSFVFGSVTTTSSVVLSPYLQSVAALPQTADVNAVKQWIEDPGVDPSLPFVCPWLAEGKDYNRPRDLCLGPVFGSSGGAHASHCLGPGTLRSIAVSFSPSAPSVFVSGGAGVGGISPGYNASSNAGPLLTTIPAGECVLLGQLIAFVQYSGLGFPSTPCTAFVSPPLPRDQLGLSAANLRDSMDISSLHTSCLNLPSPPVAQASGGAVGEANGSLSSCPRWPSPFPIVGDTLPMDYQGPPPTDQTSFLTNEEAWCAFNQYLEGSPTAPTTGVTFLCSADRRTVFVVTCGGDRFPMGDVDFNASSQGPPMASGSWHALWSRWVAGSNDSSGQQPPPYYAGLGGVPLMAFDAVDDPSGLRFHCSACIPFIEAGEGPLPYVAVAIAALKDALLVALGVWIMSFRRLQSAVVAAVAWLSSLVVPFRDPALARRLRRSVAEALRTCDEVTPTQLAQTARALIAFSITAAATHNKGECIVPEEGNAIPSSSPTDDPLLPRAFEAFLLHYVMRGCQRNIKVGLLEQWLDPDHARPGDGHGRLAPSTVPRCEVSPMSPDDEDDAAACRSAALEVAHRLCALRTAWGHVMIEVPHANTQTTTYRPDANLTGSQGEAADGDAATAPLLTSALAIEEGTSAHTHRQHTMGIEKEACQHRLHSGVGRMEYQAREADEEADAAGFGARPGGSVGGGGGCDGDASTGRLHAHACAREALGAKARALWAALDSHDLLVPVTFVDTHIDHRITPPAWLLLLHLLFCSVYMLVILVTVVRAHDQTCSNVTSLANDFTCVLSSRWVTYQAIFFRYINSTAAVSLIVNAIIRVLYLPPPPPDLSDHHRSGGQDADPNDTNPMPSHLVAGLFGSLDCVLVLRAGRAATNASATSQQPPQQEGKCRDTNAADMDVLSAGDEAMVAVLRRGERVGMRSSLRSLAWRCLTDRFVQCGLLLPLPVLLTHALVGAVLYAWVTIPVIGLLVLVAVAVDRAALTPSIGSPTQPMTTNESGLVSDDVERMSCESSPSIAGPSVVILNATAPLPSSPPNHLGSRTTVVLRVVTARLAVRVLITFTCVLLCQTTVNWMVLAYTGGGGNARLPYTFIGGESDENFYRQAQSSSGRIPNTFLHRHRFPPPPSIANNGDFIKATAGTAAAVERLQDAQYVSYLGVLVREFEARSFACTLEMLAASLDGSMQTLSVLF